MPHEQQSNHNTSLYNQIWHSDSHAEALAITHEQPSSIKHKTQFNNINLVHFWFECIWVSIAYTSFCFLHNSGIVLCIGTIYTTAAWAQFARSKAFTVTVKS